LPWRAPRSAAPLPSSRLFPCLCSQHYARERDGLEYFLTYADNNAVGYFAKQSFTKTVTLEKDKVGGPPALFRACALL
jgi:hypothetical protein